MPQLGNTVEECVLTRWVKRRRRPVAAGDVVAEIETDKTTFEVTRRLMARARERSSTKARSFPSSRTSSSSALRARAPSLPAGCRGSDAGGRRTSGGPVARHKREFTAGGSRSDDAARRSPISPRASRFAATHNFHPAFDCAALVQAAGSSSSDVRRAFEAGAPRNHGRQPGAAPPLPRPIRPVTGLRATIARRMRESLASTAQYTLHASADATGLLALRARVKTGRPDGMPTSPSTIWSPSAPSRHCWMLRT